MIRILIILIVIVSACNNNPTSTVNGNQNADTTTRTAWTNEDQKEFLDACMENAGNKILQDSAFIYCKCVLQQIENKFPNLDSASVALIDTAKAAEYLNKCR